MNYDKVTVHLAHILREIIANRSCYTLFNVFKKYGTAMFKNLNLYKIEEATVTLTR